MRRREFLLGATAALASSKAMALSRSRRALLGGNSWVLRGAAIDLDFANNRAFGGAPASLLTCTRASSGYATNGGGTLTSFPANTLRIGSGTGLLVEEARTNLVTYSNVIGGTNWSQNNITPSTVAGAPDSTAALTLLTTVGGTFAQTIQTITVAAGTTYTASAYLKNGNVRYVTLSLANANDGFYAVFDLQAGTVTQTGALTGGIFISASITAVGSFFRVSITGFTSAATTPFFILCTSNTGVYSADLFGRDNYVAGAGATFSAWGAQVELGSFPTSYIPTTAAAVTRAADVVQATGAFGTIGAGGAMSLYVEDAGIIDASNGPLLLDSSDDSDSYLYFVAGVVTRTVVFDYITLDGGGTSSNGFGYGDTSARFKVAFGGDRAGTSWVGNNGVVSTRAGVYALPVAAGMYVGSQPGGSRSCNSYIRRLTAWRSRLSDGNLKALTQA